MNTRKYRVMILPGGDISLISVAPPLRGHEEFTSIEAYQSYLVDYSNTIKNPHVVVTERRDKSYWVPLLGTDVMESDIIFFTEDNDYPLGLEDRVERRGRGGVVTARPRTIQQNQEGMLSELLELWDNFSSEEKQSPTVKSVFISKILKNIKIWRT
jgi:hypothetical protein